MNEVERGCPSKMCPFILRHEKELSSRTDCICLYFIIRMIIRQTHEVSRAHNYPAPVLRRAVSGWMSPEDVGSSLSLMVSSARDPQMKAAEPVTWGRLVKSGGLSQVAYGPDDT